MEKYDYKPREKMPYEVYIERAKDLAIAISKNGRQAFIWPDYRHMLMKENLGPERCKQKLSWDELFEILQLEVEMWNKNNSDLWQFVNILIQALNNDINKNVANSIKPEKILEQIKLHKDINSKAD